MFIIEALKPRPKPNVDTKVPDGFSSEKGAINYWLDAVRAFWSDTHLMTDTEEVRWIVNWLPRTIDTVSGKPSSANM